MPVTAITGAPSSFASYRPLSRWIPPGPMVARQQPSLPVSLACAPAMKAADSSCRTWMKRTRSRRVRIASMTPLMPSPGSPKIVSTPQLASMSTRMSAVVLMECSRLRPTEVGCRMRACRSRGHEFRQRRRADSRGTCFSQALRASEVPLADRRGRRADLPAGAACRPSARVSPVAPEALRRRSLSLTCRPRAAARVVDPVERRSNHESSRIPRHR